MNSHNSACYESSYDAKGGRELPPFFVIEKNSLKLSFRLFASVATSESAEFVDRRAYQFEVASPRLKQGQMSLAARRIVIETLIHSLQAASGFLVPALAFWSIACLYTIRSGCRCTASECVFFGVLLLVAGATIRTVVACDNNWLLHTSSLGVMIVAGSMKRPSECLG